MRLDTREREQIVEQVAPGAPKLIRRKAFGLHVGEPNLLDEHARLFP